MNTCYNHCGCWKRSPKRLEPVAEQGTHLVKCPLSVYCPAFHLMPPATQHAHSSIWGSKHLQFSEAERWCKQTIYSAMVNLVDLVISCLKKKCRLRGTCPPKIIIHHMMVFPRQGVIKCLLMGVHLGLRMMLVQTIWCICMHV